MQANRCFPRIGLIVATTVHRGIDTSGLILATTGYAGPHDAGSDAIGTNAQNFSSRV